MTTDGDSKLLTPELLALVGRSWPAVTYEVEAAGIRMWARAVGFDDPVYYDEGVAHERGFERIPAPPGYVGAPVLGIGDPEPGPPIRGLHPDVQRSLNGGTEFDYRDPILAGDKLIATTTIAAIRERQGSIGQMLLFFRETHYERAGDVVAIMRQTVINY
jgi:hypothetical protein